MTSKPKAKFCLQGIGSLPLAFTLALGKVEVFFFFFFLTLHNCISFAKYQNESTTVYMCSPSWTLLPPPSPYHPSGSSQCTNSLRKLLLMRWFILWFGSKDKYQCLIKTKTCITRMYAQPLSRVWFFLTPRTATCQAPLTTTFSRKHAAVGCHFLLQEIFLTQGLNLCLFSVVLPTLQVGSLPLSHLGSPHNMC